jgi:hypothetical protein
VTILNVRCRCAGRPLPFFNDFKEVATDQVVNEALRTWVAENRTLLDHWEDVWRVFDRTSNADIHLVALLDEMLRPRPCRRISVQAIIQHVYMASSEHAHDASAVVAASFPRPLAALLFRCPRAAKIYYVFSECCYCVCVSTGSIVEQGLTLFQLLRVHVGDAAMESSGRWHSELLQLACIMVCFKLCNGVELRSEVLDDVLHALPCSDTDVAFTRIQLYSCEAELVRLMCALSCGAVSTSAGDGLVMNHILKYAVRHCFTSKSHIVVCSCNGGYGFARVADVDCSCFRRLYSDEQPAGLRGGVCNTVLVPEKFVDAVGKTWVANIVRAMSVAQFLSDEPCRVFEGARVHFFLHSNSPCEDCARKQASAQEPSLIRKCLMRLGWKRGHVSDDDDEDKEDCGAKRLRDADVGGVEDEDAPVVLRDDLATSTASAACAASTATIAKSTYCVMSSGAHDSVCQWKDAHGPYCFRDDFTLTTLRRLVKALKFLPCLQHVSQVFEVVKK